MKRYVAPIAVLLVSTLAAAQPRERSAPRGEPGKFDYYLLTLSWSPNFCATGKNDPQCQGNRRFAFVVHGLWPQYEKGWPQFCQPHSTVPKQLVDDMLIVMPSPALIQHEWDRHGTCSGLNQQGYFDLIRRVRSGIRIPSDFEQPVKDVVRRPDDIVKQFSWSNPGFGPLSITVDCSGRYLSEVRICLDKDLKPHTCTDTRNTCKEPAVILRPVR